MDKNLWERCVQFHGHECPDLAIGYKAVEAVREQLGIRFSTDKAI
ncbi:hypothetical protein BR63_17290 [Thermanaerosceptrum fracticalcis]|uniref:Formylmethanofuran dehydrogenase subunit E domain-containing protein n=1 Tax=Thermanaerosceptrum fracticalcis TaxID=1712410 RepID=A0A7G6E704_THEFR|nr:FmdE family protein [Thermanaerosceptrum fracticalcis]QNB47858.1 hypothetical protein BR63_17290 [Thermanaerosceptrum fracticalcis]